MGLGKMGRYRHSIAHLQNIGGSRVTVHVRWFASPVARETYERGFRVRDKVRVSVTVAVQLFDCMCPWQ